MGCKVQTVMSNCHVQQIPCTPTCIYVWVWGICRAYAYAGYYEQCQVCCMYTVYNISSPVTYTMGFWASAAALRSLIIGNCLCFCNHLHLHVHSAQAGLSGALVGLGSWVRMGIWERPRVKPESKPGYKCILLLYLLLSWEFGKNAPALSCVCQSSRLATMGKLGLLVVDVCN